MASNARSFALVAIGRQRRGVVSDTGCMSVSGRHSPSDLDVVVNDERHPCGERLVLCEQYDAFYYAACDVWAESACGDPACVCCPGRPTSPSDAHLPGSPVDHR